MNRISDRLLGKYELLNQLGTTGLASVYRARDIASHTIVALKVLHAYFSREEELLGRYFQEVAQVQKLRHPNIVPVHGIEQEGELIALVMDYVPWPSLKARRSRVLPGDEVLTILRQVAQALDYAHSQGIVHRDLRPSNVFYDPESGQVMVSDFGTASLVEGMHELIRSTVNTPAPSYASPEQIQGQATYARPTIDPRNDIYALGTLAYELLTGELPFDALNPYTILSRQLAETPISPSSLNEALPPSVDDVILKALRPRPEERYASCGEMVEALEQVAGRDILRRATTAGALDQLEPSVETPGPIAAKDEDAWTICPRCGSDNPALERWCSDCWASLVEQPVVTREEAKRLARRYLAMLRRRKRISLSIVGSALAALLAFWAYSITDIRPPLPAPTSTISSQSAIGEWSMVQRDIHHTGAAPGPDVILNGSIKWSFKLQEPILSTPAVSGGRVFIATTDRRVVALDEATGDVLWAQPVSGPVNSWSDATLPGFFPHRYLVTPSVADGLMFIGLRDGTLLALDTATGNVEWSYATGGPIYGSATVFDGSLYIGSSDNRLYSFDASTGEVRWIRETEHWVISPPTISQGIVIAGSHDENLYMIDASNGTLRYMLDIGSSIQNAITVVGDAAYFTVRPGDVVAIDYRQKDVPFQKAFRSIWYQLFVWGMVPPPPPAPGFIWGLPVDEPVDSDLATADGRLFVATVAGILRAVDLETGSLLWKVDGLGNVYTSPIISGDTVILAAFDGTIHSFDASTGEQRWAVSTSESIVASPTLADGTLYVPTTEGNLYALQ